MRVADVTALVGERAGAAAALNGGATSSVVVGGSGTNLSLPALTLLNLTVNRGNGVTLAGDVEVRVWDSTAEVRYLVIPTRPEGTEGMSEEALADLVTRDSMIGTGLARQPEAMR